MIFPVFCFLFSVIVWVGRCTTLYHNQFAVYVPRGDKVAQDLASKHGFTNLGQIGSLDNYYLFEHARLRKRSTESSRLHEVRFITFCARSSLDSLLLLILQTCQAMHKVMILHFF